jgi:hypothetical protein
MQRSDQTARILTILRELEFEQWPNVLAEVLSQVMPNAASAPALWRDLREQTEALMAEQDED